MRRGSGSIVREERKGLLLVVASVLACLLVGVSGALVSPFFFTLLLIVLASFFLIPPARAVSLTAALSLGFLALVIGRGQLDAAFSYGAMGVQVTSLWLMAYAGSWLSGRLAAAREGEAQVTRQLEIEQAIQSLRETLTGARSDLKTGLDEALERIGFALKIPAAAVYLLDEEKKVLVLNGSFGFPIELTERVAVQRSAPPESTLAARTAALGEPVVVEELISDALTEDLREASLLSGWRSGVSLPLFSRGRMLGVLQLFYGEHAFSPLLLPMLASLAAELGLCMENLQLREREARIEAELAALQGAAQTMTANQTLAEAVDGMREAVRQLGYPDAALYLWDEARSELVMHRAAGHEGPASESVAQAARSGEVVLKAPGEGAPRALAVPLKVKGRAIGVLEIGHADRLSETEIGILTSFANQAAIAIENARLYDVERSRTEQLAALRDFSAHIQTAQTESEVIAALLHYMGRLSGSRQQVMYRPEKGALEAVQHLGEPGRCGAISAIPAEQCLAFRSARTFRHDGPQELPCPVKRMTPGIHSYLCQPLVAGAVVTGVLHLDSTEEGHWSEERVQLVRGFADYAAPVLQNIRYNKQLEQKAIHDELTGLYNRRFLEEHLQKQLAMASRYTQPLAVLMLDIDHFKEINDRFGHDAGDRVLQSFAGNLARTLRSSDVVARWGGEEFVIVLPTTGESAAQMLAGKVRQAAAELAFTEEIPGLERITVSIGAAAYPEHGKTVESLLKSADLALYRAKQRGRNRVESASAGA